MRLATSIALFLTLAAPAAGADLIAGLGGETGYGENVVVRNDDSFVEVDLTPIWPGGLRYFGTVYSSVWLNNNGNLTFDSGSSTFTPGYITAAASNPIIAAWYADVDTRQVPEEDVGQFWDNGIIRDNLIHYDIDTVAGIFTATWNYVGYFSYHSDKQNAFQIRLIRHGGVGSQEFDIEFRYRQLQWTTGDASGGHGGLGGTIARAGYSAGNGISYFELPQSGDQAAMLALATTPGNTGTAGIWNWHVRKPDVDIAPVITHSNATAIDFTFTLPADATGFDLADITVTGGTGVALSGPVVVGDSQVFTLPVTGIASGTLLVEVAANRVASPFGDLNIATQQSVIIDFLAPAVPVMPTIGTGKRPLISGSTEANATVHIFLDGVERGTAIANGSGNWTWQAPSSLHSGSYTVTVVVEDLAGNASAASPGAAYAYTARPADDSSGGGCGGGLAGLILASFLLLRLRLRRAA